MAPGDVCHGPRCSLAGLGPVALGCRPCCCSHGLAGSPQCIRPMGCWFFPVPRTLRVHVCAVSGASWLLFTGVPSWRVVLLVRCPRPLGSCSPVCPLGALLCVCGVLGHLAPAHRCARPVRCFAFAVSWAPWLLFTGVPARCVVLRVRCPWPIWLLFTFLPAWCVVLRVRCPGPLGSCPPVCSLGALFCLCGDLGHLVSVHWCARSARCFASAVSWATWLLFISLPARCVALRVRCPGSLGSCSPVCPPGLLCSVCGALGLLAPVHRCAHSVFCFACAVSWAPCLLFTGEPARCVSLRVRCPGPLGSCSPVRLLGVLCCVCGVLGPLALAHRCASSVCCVACAVSWATWLLFTGAPARFVVLRVRCPGPLDTCLPVRPLGVLCCIRGFLGPLAPVHRCALPVCCVACAVSWVPWLLFTGVPARCVVLRVRCPGPLGSCSPVRQLGVLCCMCGVLGPLAPVHRVPVRCGVLCARCPGPLGSCSPVCPLGLSCCVYGVPDPLAPGRRCARSVCCVACAVPWAPWLLFTGVPEWFVVLRVRCPGQLGSCSPVCPRGVLCCVCGVLGPSDPVHRCARSVRCFACAVSWASWLLFTGVPAQCVSLRGRCPGPLGSCSPVRPLGVLCGVCGVLGPLAPVYRCARSVCFVVCAVSWATWLLFTGAPPRCAVLRVRCPGSLGSCSPCARSVCCVVCAVSWATRLLFTGAPARFVVLRVRCPGPPGTCSPVRPLGVLCCVRGVLDPLAPVHRCARSVCCVACAVSWATWLLFTGAPARFVVLRVRCCGPLGSCSPVRPLGVLCFVRGVRNPLAPVHRSARSVCCVTRTVFWPLASCSPVCSLGVLCRVLCVRGGAAGRTLVHPDNSCSLPAGTGYPPGAHSSIRTAAVS